MLKQVPFKEKPGKGFKQGRAVAPMNPSVSVVSNVLTGKNLLLVTLILTLVAPALNANPPHTTAMGELASTWNGPCPLQALATALPFYRVSLAPECFSTILEPPVCISASVKDGASTPS